MIHEKKPEAKSLGGAVSLKDHIFPKQKFL
jgi:hypothetical protein